MVKSENQIIVRVMTGDMSAFQRLYDDLAPVVYKRAVIVLQDSARAYRVVKNTFADVYRFAWRLDDPEKFEEWMYRITNHHIRNNGQLEKQELNLQNVWNELYSELVPPAQASFDALPAGDEKVVSYLQAQEEDDGEWNPIIFPPEFGEPDDIFAIVNTSNIEKTAVDAEYRVHETTESAKRAEPEKPRENPMDWLDNIETELLGTEITSTPAIEKIEKIETTADDIFNIDQMETLLKATNPEAFEDDDIFTFPIEEELVFDAQHDDWLYNMQSKSIVNKRSSEAMESDVDAILQNVKEKPVQQTREVLQNIQEHVRQVVSNKSDNLEDLGASGANLAAKEHAKQNNKAVNVVLLEEDAKRQNETSQKPDANNAPDKPESKQEKPKKVKKVKVVMQTKAKGKKISMGKIVLIGVLAVALCIIIGFGLYMLFATRNATTAQVPNSFNTGSFDFFAHIQNSSKLLRSSFQNFMTNI